MIKRTFEWAAAKAEANYRKHGVDFPTATEAFGDPFGIEAFDTGATNMARTGSSSWPWAAARCWLWSTRSAARRSALSQRGRRPGRNMTTITAKIRESDGQLVRVHGDGRKTVLDKAPLRPMTEDEIMAAALSDPDAQPLTDETAGVRRRVAQARVIRRTLHLTQEEFAARYHIPIGTLRDWEQGRAEPDQPARAYLRAIAGDPEAVRRALDASPLQIAG